MAEPSRWPPRLTLNRRQVLGAAAGAGLGAGLGHLLVPHPPGAASVRPTWSPALDSERDRLAHLLRRATFAITAEALERARQEGFDKTLDRLLESEPQAPASPFSPHDPTRGAMYDYGDLQAWWISHTLATPTPFAERMTLFWHGHFTTEIDKAGLPFMYWQNLTWRSQALGSLAQMLWKVTVDPAMLVYLDLAQSDASDPVQPPNENYARELMELFTMGPGQFTEADVKAAARALAGWTTPPPDRQVEMVVDEATGATEMVDVWDRQSTGIWASEAAFDGEVTFLGRKGRLGLADVIDRILTQPVTATFIARKVALSFISPRPAADTIRTLADAFRGSGYQVRALMRAAFLCPEFAAPSSYRSLVRSPAEFMIAAALAIGAPKPEAAQLIAGYGDSAGQALFQPPNVAGWPPNAAWISPSRLLARFNFVAALVDSVDQLAQPAGAAALHLEGNLSGDTSRRLAAARSDRERWLLLLTSPEFNLK